MAQSAVDKIPPGPKLDALTAEKVFGWQSVHKHQGSLVGRKQDKAGHWRLAKVPNYSTNPLHSYSVKNRMKQLGRSDRYQKNSRRLPTPKYSCRMGFTGSTLPCGDQSCWTVRPGHSVEPQSQTDSKIDFLSLSHCGFFRKLLPAASTALDARQVDLEGLPQRNPRNKRILFRFCHMLSLTNQV